MLKFARIAVESQVKIVAVDDGRGRYWDIGQTLPGFTGDMVDLIRRLNGERLITTSGDGQPLTEVKLLAPIDRPRRNLFCVGKNYHEHAKEFQHSGFDSSAVNGETAPEAPVFFTKPASTITGPGDAIPSHADVTDCLDYEAELAIVIGKGGRNIKAANAMEHIFGYTIVNDVTARDLQKRHRQWFLGKGLDGFCPMGPYIVPADQIDGQNLSIRCWVNGELRQSSNTRDLIFGLPTLIETLSAGITLEPGDVIATGTPAGVGIGFTPPRYLNVGDTVRIEVEGIGVLENVVGPG